jgi:hypothetical protein
MMTSTGEVFMTGEASNHIQIEGKVAQRRNKRVRIRFPVSLEVPSAEGITQTIAAQTVVVSHAGATLDVDVNIPDGIGIQVSPPFGGTLLAEVNGTWVDQATGRHQISIRLIDPPSWTSPERLSTPGGIPHEELSLRVHPAVSQMLSEYAAYMSETDGVATHPEQAAAAILERALLADERFQQWLSAKILEDLQAWEEACVRGA